MVFWVKKMHDQRVRRAFVVFCFAASVVSRAAWAEPDPLGERRPRSRARLQLADQHQFVTRRAPPTRPNATTKHVALRTTPLNATLPAARTLEHNTLHINDHHASPCSALGPVAKTRPVTQEQRCAPSSHQDLWMGWRAACLPDFRFGWSCPPGGLVGLGPELVWCEEVGNRDRLVAARA